MGGHHSDWDQLKIDLISEKTLHQWILQAGSTVQLCPKKLSLAATASLFPNFLLVSDIFSPDLFIPICRRLSSTTFAAYHMTLVYFAGSIYFQFILFL